MQNYQSNLAINFKMSFNHKITYPSESFPTSNVSFKSGVSFYSF